MTQAETEQLVEEALGRWRNPPPLTEAQKRLERALEESLEEMGEDED